MKKLLSLLMAALIVFCAIPAAAAADAESYAYGPYTLDYKSLVSGSLKSELLGEGVDAYIRFSADAGDYGNNSLIGSFTPTEFALPDYPFVKIKYRTDSESDIIDCTITSTNSEAWGGGHPKANADGNWHEFVVNINDMTGGGGPAPAGDTTTTFRMKPFGSGNKTLKSTKYFDIAYIACFKTKADADAFSFKGEAGYEFENVEDREGFVYEKATDAQLDEYKARTEARIAEILSTPTEVEVKGTKYYVSVSGSDNNDGKSPESAWRTVKRVNEEKFKPGDGVFFKRGDKFRTDVTLNTLEGVTYSAFGEGDKPMLVCSVDASTTGDWTLTEYKNVYVYNQTIPNAQNVGTIVFNGGEAWGVMVQPKTDGSRLQNGRVYNGYEFFDSTVGSFPNPGGLDHDLEFYYDWNNFTLYLYSEKGNPSEVFDSIELVDKGNGIGGTGKNVTIDNIAIFGAGSHGIGYGSVENLTVQNCAFYWIGGTIQGMNLFERDHGVRYGNAVESYGSSENFVIRNCYATQVYDCCWTVQCQDDATMNNIEMYDNVAEFCNTGLEVWCGNGGSVTNMNLHDNITRYCGYGWSHQRPGKDGNFFYGASNVGVNYKNNNVTRNLNYFTFCNALLVCATGPEQYNFHDNIYVMENNKKLGGIAANPSNGLGGFKNVAYTEESVRKAYNTGFESGTKFYYTEPLGDAMYKLDSNRYVIPTVKINISDVFKDVKNDFWAAKAIDYVYSRELFAGTAPSTFAPDAQMTRAMLATVIVRMTGYDANFSGSAYKDVKPNSWYAKYVSFAKTRGLVGDVEYFRPDEPATREEMADMLYRLAKYNYIKLPEGSSEFTDSADIGEKYRDDVDFCVGAGIISGYSDNTIKPQGHATRAEVATMIMRYNSYAGKAGRDDRGSGAEAKLYSGESLASASFLSNVNMKPTLSEDKSYVRCTAKAGEYGNGSLMVSFAPMIAPDTLPIIKFAYRTDSEKATIDVSMRSTVGESWFPSMPTCVGDGKWHEVTLDLRNMKNGNGPAPIGDRSAVVYLKPFGTTVKLESEKYFDIAAVAYFANTEEAAKQTLIP